MLLRMIMVIVYANSHTKTASGTSSRVAIGIGGGIVGEGVGATGRMIHIISE